MIKGTKFTQEMVFLLKKKECQTHSDRNIKKLNEELEEKLLSSKEQNGEFNDK